MLFNRILNPAAAASGALAGLWCLAVCAAVAPLAAHASPVPSSAPTLASVPPKHSAAARPSTRAAGQGPISYYGPGFHGQRTANGERFDAQALTMAHRTLPFGTQVRVTNLRNGRSVMLRVNDRGPWARGRIADVSAAAARRLGMQGQGVVRARLDVVSDARSH
jgi:rare lipoprotein A